MANARFRLTARQIGVARTLSGHFLPLIFLMIFLRLVYTGWENVLLAQPFAIGDWLINYAGGFVRRGLTGEIVLRLSKLSGVDAPVLVYLAQLSLYFIFFLFSWLLLRRRRDLVSFLFLLLSPALFLFPVYDAGGAFRKEILFLAVFAVNVYLHLHAAERIRRRVFLLTLYTYPLLVLAHEMLLMYLPLLLILRLHHIGEDRAMIVHITAGMLLSLGTFAAVLSAPVTTEQVAAIETAMGTSWQVENNAINWLQRPAEYARQHVAEQVATNNYLLIYPLAALLAAAAFYPVRKQLRCVLLRNIPTLLAVLSVLFATIFLCAIAVDWGRFIHTFFMGVFFLLFLADGSTTSLPPLRPALRHIRILYSRRILVCLFVLFLYATAWYLPHFGDYSLFQRSPLGKVVHGRVGLNVTNHRGQEGQEDLVRGKNCTTPIPLRSIGA